MSEERKQEPIVIRLTGRIDSANSAATEQTIRAELGSRAGAPVVLDAEKLLYISSAGLRVILRLKKAFPDLRIVNVTPEVYEIFEMTGFTEMMTVEKAYRTVSVEGCEVIGEGQNGKVYRLDPDTVVKTYKNADALAEIQHEREVARLALILGVPTAISYDVVRVGDSYGSVFELLNAHSFAKILAEEPERMDWCVNEYVTMLKRIHAIEVPAGKLPPIKKTILAAIRRMKDVLADGLGDKLEKMAGEIPESNRMIHGDYHTKNIVLADGEVLLIDMDTLSVGHPIFELAKMFNASVGFYENDPEAVRSFQGFDFELSKQFWERSFRAYLGTNDPLTATAVEEKIRCISYAILIDWKRRHSALDTETDRETLALWIRELTELLGRVDSLVFDPYGNGTAGGSDPNELTIEALIDNLPKVLAFVDERLEAADCPMKTQMQINLAVEEIFVNIASYAYAPETGDATIRMEIGGEPLTATFTFTDSGIPYNPLAKEDPDIALAADDRTVGGLGIYLTKQLMDDAAYSFRDGRNILTLKKKLQA